MFIIIENHQDDIDSYCNLVGAFDSMDEAKVIMRGRYLKERDDHAGCEADQEYFDDDEARLYWSDAPDFFDWHIFEINHG